MISGHTETWRISELLRRRIEEAREFRERPNKRMMDLRHLVSDILSELPEEEMVSFIFEKWWTMELPGRGYSACQAAQFEETKWQSFRLQLQNVPTHVRFSPSEKSDLIGLPYEGALARVIERKRLEQEERERSNQAKLEADRASRIGKLRTEAIRHFGDEAEGWLKRRTKERE